MVSRWAQYNQYHNNNRLTPYKAEKLTNALRDYDNVVNIFIHADFEFRRKRAIEEHGILSQKSASIVKKIDKERSSYYKYYTDSSWGEAKNYHICLDTGFMGIDEAVRIIIDFIERKYK